MFEERRVWLVEEGMGPVQFSTLRAQLKKRGVKLHHRLHSSTEYIVSALPLDKFLTRTALRAIPPPTRYLPPSWLSQCIQDGRISLPFVMPSTERPTLPQKRPRPQSPTRTRLSPLRDSLPSSLSVQKDHTQSPPRPDSFPTDEECDPDLDMWLNELPSSMPDSATMPQEAISGSQLRKQLWKINPAHLACQKRVAATHPQKDLPEDEEDVLTGTSSPNKRLIEVLYQMECLEKNQGEQWRALAYRKAITALKRHPEPITTTEQALALRGIGEKIAKKIGEINETGSLRRLTSDRRTEAVQMLSEVWGAGPEAVKRWLSLGYYTLEDLQSHPEALTKQQTIGVRFYHEFQMRIPREEVAEIFKRFSEIVVKLAPDITMEVCGSYRRGASDCGDIDVLLTHTDASLEKTLLHLVVAELHKHSLLTADLSTGSNSKYMGVCQLPPPHGSGFHRRIDIQFIPKDRWPLALLYFTGSAHFNRSMRLWARRNGYSLCEKSLTKRFVLGKTVAGERDSEEDLKGQPIPIRSEREVFHLLGLEFVPPTDRNI